MDEPFVDDAAFRMESGIPVRYYAGGKETGSCVDIPCPTEGDEGDVLTVVDGAPVWAPPTGGSTPSGPVLDPGFWLKPKTCYFKQDQLPYNDGLRARANYRGGMLGRPLSPSYWTDDQIVLASGTSAGFTGVLLPATTDGQTFATPWDTDAATYYRAVSFGYNGEFQEYVAAWELRLEFDGDPGGYARMVISIDGDAPSPAEDTLWWECETMYASGAGAYHHYVPSAMNTITSTQTDAPGVWATWSNSVGWILKLAVWRVASS